MDDENYKDADGNPIPLEELVRKDPDRAVYIIRRYEAFRQLANESMKRIEELARQIR